MSSARSEARTGTLTEISSVRCPHQWLKAFAEQHGTDIKGLAIVTLLSDETCQVNWVGETPGRLLIYMANALRYEVEQSVLGGRDEPVVSSEGA